MAAAYTIWNLERWFRQLGMEYEAEIRDETMPIEGVRLEEFGQGDNFAVVCDCRMIKQYQQYDVIICHGENRILFKGRSVGEILNETNAMLSSLKQWEQQLRRINIRKGSIRELLDATEKVFPFPIMLIRNNRLFSYSAKYVAQVKSYWERYRQMNFYDIWEMECGADFSEEIYKRRQAICISKKYLSENPILLRNIWVDGYCDMKLLAFNEVDSFSGGDVNILNQLAVAIQNSIRQNYEKYRNYNIPESVFRQSVYNHTMHPQDMDLALAGLKWKRQIPYLVYVLEAPDGLSLFALDKLMELFRRALPETVVFELEERLVIVSNLEKKQVDEEKEWMDRFTKKQGFQAACSCIGDDLYNLPNISRQAVVLLSKENGTDGGLYDGMDYSTEYIYDELTSNAWVQSLVVPEIRILEELDRKKGTEYCRTLFSYFQKGKNSVATAKLLSIHRSTLAYRLEKIWELIGEEQNCANRTEALFLSLMIMNCRHTAPKSAMASK